MRKYKIGQILTWKKDFTGRLVVYDNDQFTIDDAFIGADGYAHYLDGMAQELGYAIFTQLTNRYDVKGIAKWIFEIVRMELPFEKWSDEYDVHESDFIEVVAKALSKLGFD